MARRPACINVRVAVERADLEARMSPHEFQRLIAGVTEQLAGRPLDGKLADWLNDAYPADGDAFRELAQACRSTLTSRVGQRRVSS